MRHRALLLAAAVLLPAVATAARHLKLVRSEPAAKAVLAAPPTQVRLWFTQAPELSVTRLTLVRADGESFPLAAPTRAAAKDAPVVAEVGATRVTPGPWTIRWRTVAKDGHAMKGEIPFTVAPAATR
jgi:methionine-rich copper-binding protein CopC